MRKKLLGLLTLGIISCGMLSGCGSNQDKAYEAYKEFYREFYDEHIDRGGDLAAADCGGQIVFNEDKEPVLAIADFSGSGET